jgi:NFACT protein RNA binding domain
MQAKDYVGPTCIIRSKKKNDKGILNMSAGILLRYSVAPRQNKSKVVIVINRHVKKETSTIAINDEEVEAL